MYRILYLLILVAIGGSSIANDIAITCTADEKTAFVEFQSTVDGLLWDELGNSPVCAFDAESYDLVICFRARAVGQTGYTSQYTDPTCIDFCH